MQAEGGPGLFVRSLIGLDRLAAKRAFGAFLIGRNRTADQTSVAYPITCGSQVARLGKASRMNTASM